MERFVHKHPFSYIRGNNLLTPFQSGFNLGEYATNIYHTFGQTIGSGKEVRVVFCDISKAFDRVWHKVYCINLQP